MTDKNLPILNANLLEGLLAECVSQIKMSLDCCRDWKKSNLSLTDNIFATKIITRDEVWNVVDVTQFHTAKSARKKHWYFMERCRRYLSEEKAIVLEKGSGETQGHADALQLIIKFLGDAHLILHENTPENIKEYLTYGGEIKELKRRGKIYTSPVRLASRRKVAKGVNAEVRSIVRAEYESGEKVATLAVRHGVADRTIHRWKESEDWQRSGHLAADTILQRARNMIEQRAEASTVEATAEIEGVVARHKAATSTLMGMMNEALARAMAYPNEDPFKQLLVIKVASEIVKNVSFLDRKTWGLDDRARTSTTAIYEVLSDMENTAEKKALRIEEKY